MKAKQIILFIIITIALTACGKSAFEQFNEALAVGELSKAQEYLVEVSDRTELKQGTLQLIRSYLSVGEVDKAIEVYENVTPWHKSRYDMKWNNGSYEQTVCKLLRKRLLKDGDYERAWEYYPLEYKDENYFENAQSRYAYLSDVVADMCSKGKQEECRRFIENQLSWFVTYVDSSQGEYVENVKTYFSSNVVRDKLNAQIDSSY